MTFFCWAQYCEGLAEYVCVYQVFGRGSGAKHEQRTSSNNFPASHRLVYSNLCILEICLSILVFFLVP